MQVGRDGVILLLKLLRYPTSHESVSLVCNFTDRFEAKMPMEIIHLPVPVWDRWDKSCGLQTQPSSGSGASRAEITLFWITLEKHDFNSGMARHTGTLKVRQWFIARTAIQEQELKLNTWRCSVLLFPVPWIPSTWKSSESKCYSDGLLLLDGYFL